MQCNVMQCNAMQNVNKEDVKKYIQEQEEHHNKDDFKIEL